MQCKTLHFNACKNVHVSTLSRKSDVWKAFVMVQNTMQSIESHELEVFAVGILIFRKQDVKSFLILVLCTDRLNSERSIMWLTKISITSTQLLYIKQIISEEYYTIVFCHWFWFWFLYKVSMTKNSRIIHSHNGDFLGTVSKIIAKIRFLNDRKRIFLQFHSRFSSIWREITIAIDGKVTNGYLNRNTLYLKWNDIVFCDAWKA